MKTDSRLMDMLVGYASAHQHPINIAVHLIGIPVIMLGIFIPMTWLTVDIDGFALNLAQITILAMFIFYLTLDWIFAVVFLVFAIAVAALASILGSYPQPTALIPVHAPWSKHPPRRPNLHKEPWPRISRYRLRFPCHKPTKRPRSSRCRTIVCANCSWSSRARRTTMPRIAMSRFDNCW